MVAEVSAVGLPPNLSFLQNYQSKFRRVCLPTSAAPQGVMLEIRWASSVVCWIPIFLDKQVHVQWRLSLKRICVWIVKWWENLCLSLGLCGILTSFGMPNIGPSDSSEASLILMLVTKNSSHCQGAEVPRGVGMGLLKFCLLQRHSE